MLIGRLTRDPELKILKDNSVCKFTLAVNRRFKKDEADFFNIVA
jgi:single-strand DNA-binding protein